MTINEFYKTHKDAPSQIYERGILLYFGNANEIISCCGNAEIGNYKFGSGMWFINLRRKKEC